MCGLGLGEVVVILILALILLGPEKLPDVAKQLGKLMREFKRASDDLKGQFETELYSQPERSPTGQSLPPKPAEGTVPAATPGAAQPESAAGGATPSEGGTAPVEPEKSA